MLHAEKCSFPELANKTPEEVFEALSLFLPHATAEELLQYGPALAEAIPELKPLLGFDQRSPHHAYDLFTHVANVVEKVPGILPLRWAALLHDIGKIPTFTQDETGRGHFYGHARCGADMAETVMRRLQAPEALCSRVAVLIRNHMTKLKPESLAQTVKELGYETVDQLLYLQEADMCSKGMGTPPEREQFPVLREILQKIGEKAL